LIIKKRDIDSLCGDFRKTKKTVYKTVPVDNSHNNELYSILHLRTKKSLPKTYIYLTFTITMQEKKIIIIIDKPISEVFEFTTNPKNTQLWVPFVEEEIAEEFPPKIGTVYKSRREDSWNKSKVTEYETNKVFKLENDVFSVKYSYRQINDNSAELTYLESVKKGKLTNSFNKEVLQKLKSIMESN